MCPVPGADRYHVHLKSTPAQTPVCLHYRHLQEDSDRTVTVSPSLAPVPLSPRKFTRRRLARLHTLRLFSSTDIPTRASCVLRKEKSFLDCLKTKDAVCEVIMAENAEVTETSTPPDAQPTLPPTNHPSPPAAAAHATPSHHGHEATFVRPSDLLRPRTTSRPAAPKPERPIDRDERAGLVRERLFLQDTHGLLRLTSHRKPYEISLECAIAMRSYRSASGSSSWMLVLRSKRA